MTTQTYRLKIARANSLKLKVLSKFPADVQVGNFLTLTKDNGVYSFGVDYSKLGPGPISDPATAFIAIEDKTAGVYREVSLASLLTSGVDADLQAIAALTGAGILVRTADNTWSLRTVTGTANEITVTNGDGVLGNPTLSLPTVLKVPGSLEVVGADLKMTGGGQTPVQGTANGIYLNPNLALVQSTVETAGGVEGGFFAYDPTTTVYMGAWSSHPLVLRTGNTSRVTIDIAGAVQFNNYGAGTIFADASGNLTAKNAADTKTALSLVKGDVGLGNVDNTSDATKNAAVATLTNKTLTSPVMTAPTLGVASATSVNKVTITAPATSATLTIANGATLTASASATVSGTNTGNQTITLTGDVTGTGTGSFAATIGANKVTNAKLATMAAYTIKGNATGSSAVPTDIDISALTTKASPASGDYLMLSDQAASGALKKVTVSSLGGGGSGVSSLNGQTGALALNVPPLGRITLASGVPVMATSQAGATTVYYTPYAGNIVPIYDGTNMIPTVFTELSQATTDTTKSPAAVAASKIYDLFVWNDSGTIRCTRGPAWTNATTRGYTLTMVNGILLNNSSITNGPAASRGTWVGTIASNASSTIDFIFGTFGPVAGVFNVWNAYNRVNVGCTVVDTGTSYTYSSTTWRQARASTAMQVSFVVGAAEDAVTAIYQNVNQMVAASSAVARIGVGYDTVTAPSNNNAFQGVAASTLIISPNVPYTVNNPAPGTHYLAAMENSDGTNSNSFNLGGAISTSGLSVSLRM